MQEDASYCAMWKAFVRTPTPDCAVQEESMSPGEAALHESDPDVQFDGVPGIGTPVNLSFDNNSARLTTRARGYLNRLGTILTKASTFRVSVVGHANRTGPEDYNQVLSKKRAAAVVRYLVQIAGLSVHRFQFDGVGSSKPLPGHDPADGDNRRVTIFTHEPPSK